VHPQHRRDRIDAGEQPGVGAQRGRERVDQHPGATQPVDDRGELWAAVDQIPGTRSDPAGGPPGAPSIGQSYSGDHVGIDNDLPIPMRSMTLNFADVFQITR
jgi:hypothetical protein